MTFAIRPLTECMTPVFSEEQIERKVEMMVNVLDRQYLNSTMTKPEYDARLKGIDRWAERHHSAARRSC